MQFFVAAQSLTGRVRPNNEDNFCVNDVCLPLSHGDTQILYSELSGETAHLVGVFDGMGGYRDGEKASFLAAAAMPQYWAALNEDVDQRQKLTEFCWYTNDQVCRAADGSQMGTTCALLCLNESYYTICNVGDSPIFRIRDGIIQQISLDHNQKAEYERMTGRPAKLGQKFMLTQCIGIPREEFLIAPYTHSAELYPEDIFVLCSDGITDMLDPETICSMVLQAETVEEMVLSLMQGAMLAGGRDNATVVCVKAEEKQQGVRGILQFLKRRFAK